MKTSLLILALPLMVACGSSSPATGATGNTGTTANGSFTLGITNFDSWCTISVTSPAGVSLTGSATDGTNSVVAPSGTVVGLHGDAASGFIWATTTSAGGGWSGDVDGGSSVSKDITVTLTADKNIRVCCPFPGGSGC